MSNEAPTIPEPRAAAARRALWRQDLDAGPWLMNFADSVLIGIEELKSDESRDDDRHFEIADGAVPVYTRDLLETFSEDPD